MICITVLILAFQGTLSDTLWTETEEGYSITVSYPEIALEIETIGNRLEEYAMGQAEAFRQCYYDYYQDDPFLPEFSMELNFTQEPSPNGLICIQAWLWEYTGGAHGNTQTQAFIYHIGKNRFLNTLELLGGRDQLQIFAGEVISQLSEEEYYDMDWVERGASADPENYHTVLPVPGDNGEIAGYTVLFPPYQVDCYANGTVEVFVPAW